MLHTQLRRPLNARPYPPRTRCSLHRVPSDEDKFHGGSSGFVLRSRYALSAVWFVNGDADNSRGTVHRLRPEVTSAICRSRETGRDFCRHRLPRGNRNAETWLGPFALPLCNKLCRLQSYSYHVAGPFEDYHRFILFSNQSWNLCRQIFTTAFVTLFRRLWEFRIVRAATKWICLNLIENLNVS